jgi:hypothetical protein
MVLIASNTIHTTTHPARIWERWEAVDHWNQWDPEVSWARLDGPFTIGGAGRLKPRKGPATDFRIIELLPEQTFVTESRLPLARLRFSHHIETSAGSSAVTHSVEMDGPLTFIFRRLLGPSLAAGLPDAMERLITLAEEGDHE